MDKFAGMGKVELRAACKEMEIPYGKLNNDGMRDALREVQVRIDEEDAREAALQAQADAEHEARQAQKRREAEATAAAEAVLEGKTADLSKLGEDGVGGRCPRCGVDLSNGVCSYGELPDEGKKNTTHEFTCLGCNGEWGPKVTKRASQPSKGGTGIKIESNREQKNGVKRPSAGGVCRAVWDYCDELSAAGNGPTAKQVREVAPNRGWNVNNASIEFYQWRKFNGITGRAK